VRRFHRDGNVIASVYVAPDFETALMRNMHIGTSLSQDPSAIAVVAVEIGDGLLDGTAPANPLRLRLP
jgi:ribose transport system substrate-binding protein